MRAWMVPWSFPVGLLVTVALVSVLPGWWGVLTVIAWGWVLFPVGMRWVRRRSAGDRDAADELDELEHSYWRIRAL